VNEAKTINYQQTKKSLGLFQQFMEEDY